MKPNRLFSLGFLLCFIGTIAVAQPARILTYDEAINIALNQSYTVKSYLENKIAMQQYFEFTKAEFKPRMDFNMFAPSWNENVIEVQLADSLPVFNSYGSMRFGSELRFTYMLPTGGNFALSSLLYRDNLVNTVALLDYAKLESKQAYTSLSLSFRQPLFTRNILRESQEEARFRYELSSSYFTRGQMDIIYNVTQGYYNLYRATRVVEINRERLKNSQEAHRVARLMGEAGRIPEGDVLIAEVAVASNQADLSESIGSLDREKDRFKQLIGLELEDDFQILTDLLYDTVNVDLNKAMSEAMKNRLEVREAEINVALQEIELDRAKRVRELRGEVSAYYDITGVSTINDGTTRALFESSFDNFVDRPPNRGVTFTLSYPIFDFGRGKHRVEQEKASLRRTQLDEENTRVTIMREVRDIVRSLGEARSRLKIRERNEDVAQRSYAISRMRFENGDITSQDLGTEQERLANAQLNSLDAFIQYQLALANLKRRTMWDFKNDRSYLMEDYFQEEE